MKKSVNASRWVTGFLAIILICCLIFSLTVYIIDPFFQFRVVDNTYKLHGEYVSPGLVKNYDYDTLIIGSSMTQNFSMDVFRQELGVKPLHIGLGAMTNDEMREFLTLADRVGKAETRYCCIDLLNFAVRDLEYKNISYLFNDDLLSRMQYFLSYEAWFRFMPVDLGFSLLKAVGFSLPADMALELSIDRLEYFGHRFIFSEAEYLRKYVGQPRSDYGIDAEGLSEYMRSEVDKLIDGIDFSQSNYIFYFPPYSAHFWCGIEDDGFFEQFMQTKEYFIERAVQAGASVYDFQSEDYTVDLENYTDSKHHSPEINDLITRCFAKGDGLVTADDCQKNYLALKENMHKFRMNYPQLFD